MPYVPGKRYEQREAKPYRYVAIRVRRQQGELFDDGAKVRHFAIVSNIWEMEGQALLEWQRGKADLVAMGRALIADPELPNKARQGMVDDICRCITCRTCNNRAVGEISCTVNPQAVH